MAERTPAARRRRRRRLRGRSAAAAAAAVAALALMVLPEMAESVEAAEARFSSITHDKSGGPYPSSAAGGVSSSPAPVRRIGRLRRRFPAYEKTNGPAHGRAEGFNEEGDDEAGRRRRRLLGEEGGEERHRRHGGPPSRDAANEGDDDGVKVLTSPEAPPAAVAVSFDAAEASNQAASATQLPPAKAESEEEGRGRSWDPVGVPFSFAIASSDDSGAADGEGDNNDLVPLSSEAIGDLRSALDALVTDLFADEDWEMGSGEDVVDGDGGGAPSRRRRRLRRQQGEQGDASAAAGGAQVLDPKAAAAAATAALTRATRWTQEHSSTVLDVRYDGEAIPPSVGGTSSIACLEMADNAYLRCYLIDATVTVLVSSSPSFEFGSRPLPSSEESSLGSNLISLVQETVAIALNHAVEEGRLDEALALVNPDGPIRGTWPAYRESARVFGGGGDDVDITAGVELYNGGVPERQAEESASSEVHASSDEGEGASSAARAEGLDAADAASNATDADAADDTGEAAAKDAPPPPKGRKISDFAIVAIALGSTAALATILDCHQHIMKYFGIDVRGHGGDGENEANKSDDGGVDDESGTDPLENGGGGAGAGAGERHLEDSKDRKGSSKWRDADKDGCAPPIKERSSRPPPPSSDAVKGNRSDDDDVDNDDDIEMDCSSSLSGLGDVYDLTAEHKKKEGRGGERERGPGCPPGESSSTMLMSLSLANLSSGLHSGFGGGGGAGGGGNGGEGTNNGGTSFSLFEHGSDSGGSAMMRINEGGE